ncbi:putative Ca2+-modulated nonselective cation channel polycystin [Rosellinia necatrix]|uniref:Putative Ca2+-modulated nonselective cation channel polycystin n=1 Tax=Rosellinia necatrix TaxID=77044 RepID=A0A1W2TDT3_ROSNE|nr:putative Ca2+-modulated nonselective cation channel polycystin [Rosellinia necatrix]
MMRSLLILAAGGYTSLASAYTGTSVSTQSTVQCSTAYGSGDVAPTPIPTSSATSVTSSLFTSPATTIPTGYTRVTDEIVTTTQHTSLVVTVVLATVTSGIVTNYVKEVTTIATATWPVTTCTNGVDPKTVTKYTGTYTPVPGQATALPESYPTQVFCTTSVTSFVHLFPTVTATTYGTIHTTPTSVVYDYTTTSTSTLTYLTVTTPSATVTSTIISYVETGHAEPTGIACESEVTKTFDARCAPTNLISDHEGIGLVSGRYNANVTVVYTRDQPYGSNPTECCQLCLDNEGCGASMWGPYETCGLYYHGDQSGTPQCDFIFTYGSEEKYPAGQGIIVSNGCGTVNYE